jgi:uncharacterized protein (TIGR03435 family)
MFKQQLAVAALVAAFGASLVAQSRVAFEVTSVRPNTSGQRQASLQFTPAGDFTAVNQPVRVLLNFAFQLPLFRVEGMPDWFTTERFDVTAKAPAGLSVEPVAEVRLQLLRSLLEDRFRLKARLVTKAMPAMILTLARDDGRLGPQMRKSTVDCDAIAAARGSGPAPPVPPGPLPAPREPVCGLGGSSGVAGVMCGRAVTMAQLTNGLSGAYQRPVVDMTGLEGRFDFDLGFRPENLGGPFVSFANRCPESTGDKPSMSTAFQEQLGIRIRAGEAPVEVLVIDSVERPTQN